MDYGLKVAFTKVGLNPSGRFWSVMVDMGQNVVRVSRHCQRYWLVLSAELVGSSHIQ